MVNNLFIIILWVFIGIANIKILNYQQRFGLLMLLLVFFGGPIALIILLFTNEKDTISILSRNQAYQYYKNTLKNRLFLSPKKEYDWLFEKIKDQNFDSNDLEIFLNYLDTKIEGHYKNSWQPFIVSASTSITIPLTIFALSKVLPEESGGSVISINSLIIGIILLLFMTLYIGFSMFIRLSRDSSIIRIFKYIYKDKIKE